MCAERNLIKTMDYSLRLRSKTVQNDFVKKDHYCSDHFSSVPTASVRCYGYGNTTPDYKHISRAAEGFKF